MLVGAVCFGRIVEIAPSSESNTVGGIDYSASLKGFWCSLYLNDPDCNVTVGVVF